MNRLARCTPPYTACVQHRHRHKHRHAREWAQTCINCRLKTWRATFWNDARAASVCRGNKACRRLRDAGGTLAHSTALMEEVDILPTGAHVPRTDWLRHARMHSRTHNRADVRKQTFMPR